MERRNLVFERTNLGLGCRLHGRSQRTWLLVSPVIEQSTLAFSFRVASLGVIQVIRLICLTIESLMLILRTFIQFLRHQTTFLGRLMRADVVWFHLWQVKLLRTQNRARSGNANPANESLSWDLVVLHCPETDQRASSSETSLTVNCNCATITRKMRLNNI